MRTEESYSNSSTLVTRVVIFGITKPDLMIMCSAKSLVSINKYDKHRWIDQVMVLLGKLTNKRLSLSNSSYRISIRASLFIVYSCLTVPISLHTS